MSNKLTSNPLTQSLLIFLVCAVGVLAFFLLIILPSQKTSAELDQDIAKLNARIEEQRILTPLFHTLLQRAKNEGPPDLPDPKKTKLTQGGYEQISRRFQDIARKYNLKLEEITTDVRSMVQESGYLLMRLRLSGDFFNIRKFLVELGSIPSLEHVEEINIRSAKTSKELRLKIWLAQE